MTNNLDDFPANAFLDTGVVRLSPDQFLSTLYLSKTPGVLRVLEFSRKKLTAPPLDKGQYVAILVKNHCERLARLVAVQWGVPCPKRRKDGTLTYDE